jgi:hypothetical protein
MRISYFDDKYRKSYLELTLFPLLFTIVLNLFSVCSANPAAVVSVYEGCAPPVYVFKRTLVVAPGNHPGDGTIQNPMNSIQAMANARSGDLILFRSGYYGALTLQGLEESYITLAAYPHEAPRFQRIDIGGHAAASHWRVTGVSVVGFSAAGLFSNGWENHASNVTIFNSDNIIVDNDIVESQVGQYPWRAEIRGSGRSDSLASGILAENSRCISVTKNRLRNLFGGIAVGGDQIGGNGTSLLVSDNLIDDFGGDGIDHYGSRVLILNNRIVNSHNICDYLCIHTDGIQGWNYHDRSGIKNSDIKIIGNQIIDQVDQNLALPPSDLHGITIFDGNWNSVLIANNSIISETWHGISTYGTENTTIINNTVLSEVPSRAAWIMVSDKKGDSVDQRYGFIVRNNIASAVLTGQSGKPKVEAVVDHNFITGNPPDIFVKFDPKAKNYDLHLKQPVSRRLIGSPVLSPEVDIESRRRESTVYVGAYAPTPPGK